MTDSGDLLGQAELFLRPWAVDFNYPEENRMDAIITPEHLKMAVRTLVHERWGYFAALTGLDIPPLPGEPNAAGHIEGLYHFCDEAAVLTLRVRVSYSNPVLDSICEIIPSATLYEREFIEMFGVTIRNTPSTAPLLLADDWPAGVYPMRKSFTGLTAETDAEVKNG
jgi:NADH:ubiquinone oxidoreductase subunit C